MADAILARQLTEQVTRLRQRQTAPLILELDLTDGIGEGPVGDPLSAFLSRRKARMQDIVDGLRRAGRDDRVRALVVKVGGGRIGLARMQELREAVGTFRESGKLAVAWSETFGEFTHGNVPYYLATAFDRIYLQPSGSLGLTGVAVEQLFLHDALAKALVDALGYRDEVYADVRKEAGPDAILQYVARYQRSHTLTQRAKKLPNPRERFVAVIYASGPIRQGRSGRSPLGSSSMGSDTVAAALRSATSDERVRAVLLRVNSPGGSAVASDTIWREVVRTRAAGKPVVVSLGNVAASGGDYISMAADVIVAQPGTLTGATGVIAGKPVFEEAFGRIGITTDSVSVGRGATIFAPTHPFSEDDWQLINNWLDTIYRDFTEKVASGRRMTVEQVHEIARGRVWTGADAARNGLVDELGGISAAVEIARRRAGLPADAPLRAYPRMTPFDQLRAPESSESRPAAAATLDLRFADAWGPAWRFAAQAGLSPYGPLMLPGRWP